MIYMFRYFIGISIYFFFSSRRRHTRSLCDWSSDVCSSDLHRARDSPDLRGQARDDVRLVRAARGYQEVGFLDAGLRKQPGARPVAVDHQGVELLGRPLHERLVLLDEDDVVALVGEHPGRVEPDLPGPDNDRSHPIRPLYLPLGWRSLDLSRFFLVPPTTSTSPSCNTVSPLGMVPEPPFGLMANTVRPLSRERWRSARLLPTHSSGTSASIRASSPPRST